MNETTRVFALLGDATLRRQLQQQWRGNGTTLCGMHAEGGDSIVFDVRLIDANTSVLSWSARYPRPTRDLAGLQESVASAVAQRIAALDPGRIIAAATPVQGR